MRINSLALRLFVSATAVTVVILLVTGVVLSSLYRDGAERSFDVGEEGRYLVAVAGDALEIDDETQGFDRAIAVTFGVLAIVLLFTTMFQVRFGLAPLKRISDSLAAIRSGSAERLEGRFPE